MLLQQRISEKESARKIIITITKRRIGKENILICFDFNASYCKMQTIYARAKKEWERERERWSGREVEHEHRKNNSSLFDKLLKLEFYLGTWAGAAVEFKTMIKPEKPNHQWDDLFRAPFLWLRQRGENFFYKFLNYFDWHDKRLFQFRTKIVDSIISRCPIYRDSDSMRRATHCKYIRLHITEMKKSFFFLCFILHRICYYYYFFSFIFWFVCILFFWIYVDCATE